MVLIDPKERPYLIFGLKIASDFGATIAVPVILFVLVGSWLDARYGWGSLATIIGFFLSALLSAILIYRKTKRYAKIYEELNSSTGGELDRTTGAQSKSKEV